MKRLLRTPFAVVIEHAVTWVVGDHEMTYTVFPAMSVSVDEWTCPEEQAKRD